MTVSELFDFASSHAGQSGTCREDEFIRALNKSLTLLWPRGDWRDTIEIGRITVCANSVIRLPWQWEFVREAWSSQGNHVGVADRWYSGVAPEAFKVLRGPGIGLIATGNRPCVAFAPPDRHFFLRATYTDAPAAADEITLHGLDQHGAPVIETLVGSCRTKQSFRRLVAVAKPRTAAPLILDAISSNGSGGEEVHFLAQYQPAQTNPHFAEYSVTGSNSCSIYVRVKKRLVLVRSMMDLCPIENPVAIAFALQAINNLGRDNALYAENLTLAEETLKAEIKDDSGEDGHALRFDFPRATNLVPGAFVGLRRYGPGQPGTHNL